mmetsp:Transcript_48364/g.114211  ORF Transcript_48364/g.114211 Transcript_48364/m.114211 type:complete len:265 (+) Transcript_48364:370-1164(+)
MPSSPLPSSHASLWWRACVTEARIGPEDGNAWRTVQSCCCKASSHSPAPAASSSSSRCSSTSNRRATTPSVSATDIARSTVAALCCSPFPPASLATAVTTAPSSIPSAPSVRPRPSSTASEPTRSPTRSGSRERRAAQRCTSSLSRRLLCTSSVHSSSPPLAASPVSLSLSLAVCGGRGRSFGEHLIVTFNGCPLAQAECGSTPWASQSSTCASTRVCSRLRAREMRRFLRPPPPLSPSRGASVIATASLSNGLISKKTWCRKS